MGKNVFVLGAGFSKLAGAPLIDEFLPRARDIYANKREFLNDVDRGSFFGGLRDYYYDELSIAKSKINFDIDNIEDVFSIVDMEYTLNKVRSLEELRKELLYTIIRTLDLTATNYGDQAYKDFAQSCVGEESSLITFNYDLVLERVLENLGSVHCYCASEDDENAKIKILKLHGSSNWLKCNCGHYEQLHVKAVGELYDRDCPQCKQQQMRPLIIPPTWNKILAENELVRVWRKAYGEIAGAVNLVFIGYSLPTSDKYFRHFLTIAIGNNINLRKIIVVEPNKLILDRYKSMLEDNYARRYLNIINDTFCRSSVKKLIELLK